MTAGARGVVVHVIAEAATTEAPPDPQLHGEGLAPDAPKDSDAAGEAAAEPAVRREAALIVGRGILPAPLLTVFIAHGAKVKLVGSPRRGGRARYRPSPALDEFVRLRDLTCRALGCDRSALFAGIDHPCPTRAGRLSLGELKCYCPKTMPEFKSL